MSLKTVIVRPEEKHLYGATLAQEHLSAFASELNGASVESTLSVVDFSKAVSVAGSYLRATCLWAALCGKAHVDGQAPLGNSDKWGIRPLSLYPIAFGCNEDISEEVDDFFRSRSLPLVLAKSTPKGTVEKGRLLGTIDPILLGALKLLSTFDEATAKHLADKSDDRITVNGWSNRLSDLHALRLVSRRRDGKFWFYTSIIKNIDIWD